MKLKKLEVKTQAQLKKSFKKQLKFLNENFIILLENPYIVLKEAENLGKWLEVDTKIDIENFWQAMWIYEIVNIVLKNWKAQTDRGYTAMFKIFEKDLMALWVDFNLENKYAVDYFESLETLYLSDRKWSITATTKAWIISLLKTRIETQETPQEVSKKIQALDKNIFAPSRAELIATREIWKANEVGWNAVVQQLRDKWAKVEKKWLTVNDDRVEPSHTQNQDDWWIDLNARFSWTGDLIAPANNNPRCRCTVTYNIL